MTGSILRLWMEHGVGPEALRQREDQAVNRVDVGVTVGEPVLIGQSTSCTGKFSNGARDRGDR